jgi:DNA polymerase III epsilon subunit-like protein
MYLIFDLETTGLVKCDEFNIYPNFTDNERYDDARIVQIAWVVLDDKYRVIDKKNYIIRRDNFNIHNAKFHGITNKISDIKGVKFEIVILDFFEALKKSGSIVAHNILFDYNVMINHLFRYNLGYIYTEFISKLRFCTSFESTDILKLPMPYNSTYYKYPSLQELYTFYFKKNITNAHDAEADVKACADCFVRLIQDDRYKHKMPINKNI